MQESAPLHRWPRHKIFSTFHNFTTLFFRLPPPIYDFSSRLRWYRPPATPPNRQTLRPFPRTMAKPSSNIRRGSCAAIRSSSSASDFRTIVQEVPTPLHQHLPQMIDPQQSIQKDKPRGMMQPRRRQFDSCTLPLNGSRNRMPQRITILLHAEQRRPYTRLRQPIERRHRTFQPFGFRMQQRTGRLRQPSIRRIKLPLELLHPILQRDGTAVRRLQGHGCNQIGHTLILIVSYTGQHRKRELRQVATQPIAIKNTPDRSAIRRPGSPPTHRTPHSVQQLCLTPRQSSPPPHFPA